MLFSLKFAELGQLLGEEYYIAQARQLSDEIFEHFYRPEYGIFVERISADRYLLPGPEGSAVVPGHVIEDMWFQMDIAPIIGREERIPQACAAVLKHLAFGWDNDAGGGLLLARSAVQDHEVAWDKHDLKLCWPLTEALYACLNAWKHTGDVRFLRWYDKVMVHCMTYYCDLENGEWRQKLDRNNKPFEGAVAYPVKDPFHLPRSILLQIELLESYLKATAQSDSA